MTRSPHGGTSDDPAFGGWTPPPAPPQWVPPGAAVEQPWSPAPPPKPRARRGLIAAIVAVVALAGGGVASYVAFADSAPAGGAATPTAAVQSLVSDLNKSDLLGVLDELPVGERDALAQPVRDEIDQLKRLHVLSSSADGNAISGITFAARDLTYGSPEVITDDVQAVEITGGTVDVTADAAKLPFTSEFARLTDPHGTAHDHVDIAAAERDSGRPIWIATQRAGDRWYPSLFYTIAVNATRAQVPAASDRIPAAGADSPEDTVRALVTDVLHGDLRGALALASPDEAGVLHDYAGLILGSVPAYRPASASVKTLDLTTTSLAGGAVRVGLQRLDLTTPNGPVTLTADGDCYQVVASGQSHRFCADQASRLIGVGQLCSGGGYVDANGNSGSYSTACEAENLPAPQRQALTHLFSSLTKIGVVTTQTDGQWFVAPVRTLGDLDSLVLSGLHDNDLLELAGLGSH